eukprot:TRINITY_DN30136_c0_g1_i1.p1 TRINITY_DN30136_c0_g1~~TRINITY_DN30136_c0_g1_i1.p1  ORF type:complete len:215 (-),score=59.06 TRINITY_DN30136_c0_g1_i1:52-696(-)
MGNICCCEADATTFALDELKKRLVGETKKVQPDPRIDPEVFVTFLDISKTDMGSVRFSPAKFTLSDLIFKLSCKIDGTKTQLAGAAAAKGAAAVTAKAGASAETKTKVVDGIVSIAQAASAAADSAKEKFGFETATTRTIEVTVTVDLVKEFNVEEVAVKVKELHTDIKLAEMVLSSDHIRRFVEKAISAKASEVATRLAKQKTEKALAKIGAA